MPAGAVVAGGAHVFADAGIDRHAAAIAAVIDPAFLAEAGWDPARKVLSFAPEHPLLGRPVCRAAGCSTSAPAASRICASCRRRLAEHGLGDARDRLASAARSRTIGARTGCLCRGRLSTRSGNRRVPGCARAHAEQLRALPVADVDEFLAHRQTRPLPPWRAVRGRRLHPPTPPSRRALLRGAPAAAAHRPRTRPALGRNPVAGNRTGDRSRRRGQSAWPAAAGGRRIAGGLAAALPDQRGQDRATPCCARSATTSLAQQVGSLTDYVIGDGRGLEFTGLANCLIGHARRALSNPETEVTQGRMGPDGVRASRHGVVYRHQPGLAAGGRQTVGRRRPAETTRPTWAAHQRRSGRASPHRLPGAAVGVAAHACRPRRTPSGVGTSRHGGVPAPAGLPRIGRTDQRRRPDPGLPRGSRRAHPHPGDGADPTRRHRRRTGRGLRHRAGGRARRTRTGRTEPGPAAGNHAAAVRTPG